MAQANWQRAREACPPELMQGGEAGHRAILARLVANPDIVWQIVGDIYDVVKTEEEKAAGLVRQGRRPRRTNVALADVWATVFPEPYTMDPFPEAMLRLLNGRSQRQFARRIPCHQTTLSRLMAGSLTPDLSMLERIAGAAGVMPTFFVEYRALYLGGAVTEVLLAQPNMSVTALQRVGR